MGELVITESHGNLLHADVEALVNTVNIVGVMGKGIALQFKKAYPVMFEDYHRAAKSGDLHLGRMHVWETQQMDGPRFIVNFPTKGHWKARSKLSDIEAGLADLVRVIREFNIGSIAVPPLGCGHGGLAWREVEPVIRRAFTDLPEIDVRLYPPEGAPKSSEMVTASTPPTMTPGRAALVDVINRYSVQSMSSPGLIESQKLMYFLQEAGQPLKLRFEANRYGPYADNLRHVLALVEGHFLSGFGDGSSRVHDAEPLVVLPGAPEQAAQVLDTDPDLRARIDRVMRLIAGYESAYGLELLATVHWLTSNEMVSDDDNLATKVRRWSRRKARMFTDEHVRTAVSALRERGWLADSKVA